MENNATHGALSTDGASTWTAFAADPAGSRGSGTVAVTADGKTIIWASQGGGVTYSRDSGKTWTHCVSLPAPPPPGQGYGGYVAVQRGPQVAVGSDRVDPNMVYAVIGQTPLDSHGALLCVSTDGGVTFTPITNVLTADGLGRVIQRDDRQDALTTNSS